MPESKSHFPSVAFLGPSGTFTHAAADKYFGPDVCLSSVATIDEVFAAVESERAEFGVVPVENSTEGAVNNTQDCLVGTSANIIAEVVIPIEHNFLVQNQAKLEDISLIVSHRQSLAQCRDWLAKHWPQITKREVSSNAEAARLASEDATVAAIAGERAADLYGLNIESKASRIRPIIVRVFSSSQMAWRREQARTRPLFWSTPKTSLVLYLEC